MNNDWINDDPTYHEFPIAEFKGNPLVEALPPPPENPRESLKRLTQKPVFDESELALPACYRALLPDRLFNFMFPTSQHFELQGQIYSQILNGYRGRNPVTVLGQRLLHGNLKHGQANLEGTEASGNFRSRSPVAQMPANISFLTGLSGMGKTTLMRSILNSLGKPVIRHSSYKGEPFTETQILYIMRNVPDQCSAKAVCKIIGDRADELIGWDLYSKLFSRTTLTRTHYVANLRKIVASHHIGILAIDEAQNISLAKSGGRNEFLALILNLREELGIPIILVGTYRAAALLKGDASIVRRLVEGGFHELKRPTSSKDDDWFALCKTIWRYQWVRNPQDLDEETVNVLFDCSQGVTGIMINLFVSAQTHAIKEGAETITPCLIKDVYKERFRPLHPIIDILRENDPIELAKYDDLYFDGMAKLKIDPIQNRLETLQKQMILKQTELSDQLKTDTGKNQRKVAKSPNGKKNNLLLEDLHELLRGTSQVSPPFNGQPG